MASSRTPGRVLGPLLITGLLLTACRASSPAAPSVTPAAAPEPLASARAIRPSDIPRCQEDLLRLCADPLAALPEESRSSRRSRREESGDEAPPAPPKLPTCEPGKARECFGAAQAYEDEEGLRAALPAFVEACRQGSAPSCEHLAKAFQKDSESPAASACALAFASEACQLGSGEACVQRATAQELPGGPAFDVTCGTAALEKACALEERGACADLPSAFSWPQRRALDAEALRQAEGACTLGVAWACSFSARRHERGLGVPVDVSKALRLHEEACDLGAPTACIEGGLLRSEHAKRPSEQQYAALQLAHGLQRAQGSQDGALATLQLAIAWHARPSGPGSCWSGCPPCAGRCPRPSGRRPTT